ncbi:MAG TPA: alkaline phosphatase family protein, partial [bacterium]|nr:alkaline phosphatase family protein [bacterium]
VDPSNPVLPISHPESYAKEIQSSVGFYYTQGMPEDTKALSNKVFTDEEFMQQSRFVMEERLRMYDFELGRFKQGLLFFYFTSLDQNSHMLWHALDESHPIHEKDKASICCQYMEFLYHSMDEMLGKTLKTIDDNTTLIIMSDHGFASFRRCFQINTWLKENGYITLHDDFKQEEYEFFGNVDWSRTKAYNLGINSVYLNLRGREQKGTVDPSQKDALLKEISEKLLAVRDPENGEQVITKVYKTSEVYRGAYVDIAPDLVLGFNRGYRASWETILGGFPLGIVNDNEDKWSGDHCMASDLVPGVILSNKKIEIPDPTLADIGPTVLQEYGIEPSKEMEGRALFDTNAAPAAIKPVV